MTWKHARRLALVREDPRFGAKLPAALTAGFSKYEQEETQEVDEDRGPMYIPTGWGLWCSSGASGDAGAGGDAGVAGSGH